MDNRENYIREAQCIGLRIAYFRKLRRMTQADLAQAVHINKKYLSHIESGSASKVISLPLLIMISKALDVDLPILVDIDGASLEQGARGSTRIARAIERHAVEDRSTVEETYVGDRRAPR